MRSLFPLSLVIPVFSFAGLTYAATYTNTGVQVVLPAAENQPTQFGIDSLNLPQFNPLLGTLQGVTITVDFRLFGSGQAGPEGGAISLDGSAAFSLNGYTYSGTSCGDTDGGDAGTTLSWTLSA